MPKPSRAFNFVVLVETSRVGTLADRLAILISYVSYRRWALATVFRFHVENRVSQSEQGENHE